MLCLEEYGRMVRESRGRTDRMKRIDSPAAWHADEVGGKAGLSRALGEREFLALEAMIATTKSKSLFDLRAEDFDDPALNELALQCRQDLASGRGAVILTGLDLARFGTEAYTRIYWFLGQLIGIPVKQSERGDLLGYVRQEKDNPFGRSYTSNAEANFHNDYFEILSLACVQAASEGGESGIASGLTVHNILLEERPDLLAALYEGWFDGLLCQYKMYPPKEQWPDYFVPFFCEQEGAMSLHSLNPDHVEMVAQERGVTVPPLIKEALLTARAIAARPGVGAWFVLHAGEMMFVHNRTMLHARKAFTNSPGHERVLLRLWLEAREERKTPAFIRERARLVDRIHSEIGARREAEARQTSVQ